MNNTTLSDLNKYMEIAKEIAISLGNILCNRTEHWLSISTDSAHDIKIIADKKAEDFIFNALSKNTPFPIFGEESGWRIPQNDEHPYWIIDPIDGTVNYLHDIPICCISIALIYKDKPVIGVIHDFNRGETFAAVKDTGAQLNGKTIYVSSKTKAQDAILATGFPSQTDYSYDAINKTTHAFIRWKKIRMLGSAALSLAYVASGRIDAYQENSIMLWDVAAGWALVEAAGGIVNVTTNALEHSIDIFASNTDLTFIP